MVVSVKNQIILLNDIESKYQVNELKCILEKININTWFRSTNCEDDNSECRPSWYHDLTNERNLREDEFIKSLDEIEKSSLVIFFITNKFLSSKTFKKQCECAKSFKKVILTVKMENIDEKLLENVPIDMNELTVFEMPKIDKSMLVEIQNGNILDDNKIDDDSTYDDEYDQQRSKNRISNTSLLQKIIIKKPDDNLKHLLMFVLRVFGSDHHLKYNDEGLFIEPLNYEQQEKDIFKGPIKSFRLKKECATTHKSSIKQLIDIESKNELIIIDYTEHFYIYSRDSFIFQKTIDLNSGKNKDFYFRLSIEHYFWIDHLNQLCGANYKEFYLFDKDFQVNETRKNILSHCNCMVYSKVNKKIYAAKAKREEFIYSILKWDANLTLEVIQRTYIPCCAEFTIKIYQDYIYLFDGRNYVHILDLNLTYIGIIGQGILKNPSQIITDANNSNYIIFQSNNNVWSMKENFFSVFCVHNFQYVGSFKRPMYREKCIFNNKLLMTFVDSYEHQKCATKSDLYTQDSKVVQKFDYNVEYRLFDNKPIINTNFQLNIEDKFICKANSAYPHLYKNPYILPCGNSACLDCIYENYNILTNSYKCNLDTCKEKHQLIRNYLNPNEKFNKVFDDSLAEIFKHFKECGDILYDEYDIEKNGKVYKPIAISYSIMYSGLF